MVVILVIIFKPLSRKWLTLQKGYQAAKHPSGDGEKKMKDKLGVEGCETFGDPLRLLKISGSSAPLKTMGELRPLSTIGTELNLRELTAVAQRTQYLRFVAQVEEARAATWLRWVKEHASGHHLTE